MALLIYKNLRPCFRNFKFNTKNQFAFVSTTKKNKDTLVYPDDLFPKKSPPPPKTVEDFENPKTWVSYGYDEESYEEDRHQHKVLTFCFITGVLVCGTFLFAYQPDLGRKDWIAREAYLELHRREKHGLPLVDRNYIDPSKIELPSDEELGDTDIII